MASKSQVDTRLADKLIEILGLEDVRVLSITIKVAVDEAPAVTVERLIEVGDEFQSAFADYRLEKRRNDIPEYQGG